MLPPSDFRPAPSYPGYWASADGRVWSTRHFKSAQLHPTAEKGYLRLTIILDGRRVKRGVHQLVADAFHGPCPDGLIVLHGSPDGTDNRASNLRYGTYSQNSLDAIAHGTHPMVNREQCPAGHPYEGSNLAFIRGAHGQARRCRACAAEASRRYRERSAA